MRQSRDKKRRVKTILFFDSSSNFHSCANFKSQQLQEIMEKIRIEQGDKEYHRMTRYVKSDYDRHDDYYHDIRQFKDLGRQISAIVNMLFSVVAVFFAVYYISFYLITDMGYVRTL